MVKFPSFLRLNSIPLYVYTTHPFIIGDWGCFYLLAIGDSAAMNMVYKYLIFIYLLAILGFELRAPHLLGRHSTTWAMLLVRFALVIFQIGSWVYALASLDHGPPIYASFIVDTIGVHLHTPPCPVFIRWNGISWTLWLGWPSNHDPLE
jgi:hypothetical protein